MTSSSTADAYAALDTIIQPAANRRHSATVIVLHCLGDRADNLRQAIRFLLGRDLLQHQSNLRHIRVILPFAPRQKFHVFDGRQTNVWFDGYGHDTLNIDIPERRDGHALADVGIGAVIDAELAAGIPIERIAVAGYSMGGYMALRVGLLLRPGMAGVIGMSAFLKYDCAVYDWLQTLDADAVGALLPPVLMLHGADDAVIACNWGRMTCAELQRLGVRAEFRTFAGMRHEMRANVLVELEEWLAERLPALPADIRAQL